jgi:hypothetical protein
MRLEWVQVPRRPDWPWWAVLLVVLWVAVVAAGVYVERRTGQQVTLCHFRRLTGHPCPTCGSTRAVMTLVRGDLVRAWAHNPLVLTLGTAIAAMLLLKLGFRRRLRFHLCGAERWAARVVVIVAVGANWAYLISISS